MEGRHLLRLAGVLALGLGLTLALLWALDGGATPATAAPALSPSTSLGASSAEGPEYKPLQGPGDVYCVTPISQTYAGCTKVFTSVQYAVDGATGGEIVKVATGVYTDIHQRSNITQVVYINTPVTIRGGYTTTNNFADPPYPITQPTTLDAGGRGRVIYVNNVTVTLEGLRLTNGSTVGSITNWGGGIRAFSPRLVISGCHIFSNTAPGSGSRGGGAWIQSPGVTLANNQIYSNTTRVGGGVYLYNSADAALTRNRIHSNRTTQFGGGGLQVSDSPGARLTDNEVYSNTSQMSGGGIHLDNSDNATLTSNEIYSNTVVNGTGGGIYFISSPTATLVSNSVCSNTVNQAGGGIYFNLSSNPMLTGNQIYSNTANGQGGGLYLNQSSSARLTGNRIYSNTAATSYGGGLRLQESPTATLTNNRFYNNAAGDGGGGVYLSESPTSTLTSNVIYNNTAGNGGGVYFFNNSNTMLVNNLVAENRITGSGKGAGIFVGQSEIRLLHTTVARNTGGDGSGILVYRGVGVPTAAILTNTILVSHTVGITVGVGCSATLAGTLWGEGEWANEVPAFVNGTIISSANVIGDPSFVDPDGGDYHITGASAGRDVAVSTVVTDDIDGDSRPFGAGKDIGADECGCHVRVGSTYYRSVQAGVDGANEGDVVQVAGTCQGVETRGSTQQMAYISKTLTVRGGYSGDFFAWDPLVYLTTLDAQGQGRVIRIAGTTPGSITPTLEGLRLVNGRISSWGGGVLSRFASTIISGCHIYNNTSANQFGGGIYIDGGPNAALVNNRVYSNSAGTSSGGGLYIAISNDVTLVGNAFHNNTAASGGGVYLYNSGDANLVNNMVLENRITSGSGAGIYVFGSHAHLLHTTLARNSGGNGQGVYVSGSGYTLRMTNTILVSHTVGITVTDGNTATLEGTLWGSGAWANNLPWGGSGHIVSGTNMTGDPAFVNPEGGDYHITPASAAIDEGVPTWVSTDIDGDARTISLAPDLGADESTFVLKVAKSGPAWVNEGTPIAYTLRVTNSGLITAYNVLLTDTLPSGAFFVSASDDGSKAGGVVSWPIFDLLPSGGAVVRTFTVTASDTITNDDYVATPQGLPGVKGLVAVSIFVNHPPVAEAGSSQSVHTGTVTLDGSGSNDPDGGDDIIYGWVQTGGTTVPLSDPAVVSPTFPAPITTGVLTFTLTVTDTFDEANSDTTVVTVTNAPPVAEAGSPQAVTSGIVTLGGFGSSDPDGDPLFYLWQQTGGPMGVSLTDADTTTATFDVPPLGGVYTFTLTVSDTFGAADSDTTNVTVNLPALEVAKSGPDEVDAGEPITYTLVVTNSGPVAASFLVITDALPAGAGFVIASDGGELVGDVVSWAVDSLGALDWLTRTFTVTATDTITNTDYRVSCVEGVSGVGGVPVVTEVISERKVYLPLVLKN